MGLSSSDSALDKRCFADRASVQETSLERIQEAFPDEYAFGLHRGVSAGVHTLAINPPGYHLAYAHSGFGVPSQAASNMESVSGCFSGGWGARTELAPCGDVYSYAGRAHGIYSATGLAQRPEGLTTSAQHTFSFPSVAAPLPSSSVPPRQDRAFLDPAASPPTSPYPAVTSPVSRAHGSNALADISVGASCTVGQRFETSGLPYPAPTATSSFGNQHPASAFPRANTDTSFGMESKAAADQQTENLSHYMSVDEKYDRFLLD